jgi:hypothetical protein
MKKISAFFLTAMCCLFLVQSVKAQLGQQDITIGLITDVHLMDTSLIIQDGPALQQYLLGDRKLLRESYAISRSVMDSLLVIAPDILLVPGDLTKDAEEASHLTLASMFSELAANGTKIFVIPGNHDINNPHAFAFDSAVVVPVNTVDPEQFKAIYNNYGYATAIAADTASLSYVAEPFEGLQIFAMDVVRYDSNFANNYPETGGGFKPQVLQWVLDRLAEGRAADKVMIGMMHHNILEHFQSQKAIFSDYVLDDFETVSEILADAGLKVIYTGHFHSHDIIQKTTEIGNELFDVETGSLVTFPCPYRIMTLNQDTLLMIESSLVEAIDYETNGLTFQEYAQQYIETGLPILVNYLLTSPPYSLDSATAAMITPAVTETLIAHYQGNEGEPSVPTYLTIEFLKTSPYAFIGYALESIWNDAEPDDLTVTIDLRPNVISGGLSGVHKMSDIRIYPNPASDQVFVELPENANARLSLLDVHGKTITEMKSSGRINNINITDVVAGTYFIRVQTGSLILTRKIMKF